MKRRTFLAFAVAALAADVAGAQSLEDRLTRQLRDQGFSDIRVSRTLLGRVRIVANGADQSREIIFNPRTGEILRDYWSIRRGSSGGRIVSSGGSSGSSGSGDSDDDDDDDDDNDDDDDDDDDNSGSGSDSSGSGGDDSDDDDDDT